MYIDEIEELFISRMGVTASFPFGEQTLVYKVGEKVFMLCGLDEHPLRMNLKAIPEKVLEYQEQYSACIPAYHMNKKHWFTVILDGSVSRKQLIQMMEDSYLLVGNALPKKVKETIHWENK
ncbi:MmcQ/YjbR family DNA-binding protein [Gynurincola endophyticus]|jgi:predicted DNA-binding protein (MmcQ/YjbR family)|uniref:MmcQ/YjbR family DNA-binding protein n=1 Tax=Gynurincola endophyticus TaxID=2479004 RepID=UPI000F8D45E7|nr:MmcQ/YjbR family DNA-binding protein [Gynurincola endophyticus]